MSKIEALLNVGDEGAILRMLSRANLVPDKSGKNGTSRQKEPQPDDERKELDGYNADKSHGRRIGAGSLQVEELSIHIRKVTKPKATKLRCFRKRQV